MKVLLKKFHLNGLTTRFHPKTQKVELQTKCIIDSTMNGNTIGFCPQTQKIEAPYRDSVIYYSSERKGSFNDLRSGSNCLLSENSSVKSTHICL